MAFNSIELQKGSMRQDPKSRQSNNIFEAAPASSSQSSTGSSPCDTPRRSSKNFTSNVFSTGELAEKFLKSKKRADRPVDMLSFEIEDGGRRTVQSPRKGSNPITGEKLSGAPPSAAPKLSTTRIPPGGRSSNIFGV